MAGFRMVFLQLWRGGEFVFDSIFVNILATLSERIVTLNPAQIALRNTPT